LSNGSIDNDILTFTLNATVAESVTITVADADEETNDITDTQSVIVGDNTITIDVSELTLTAPTALVVTVGGETLTVNITE
jgi:hypothetical protein